MGRRRSARVEVGATVKGLRARLFVLAIVALVAIVGGSGTFAAPAHAQTAPTASASASVSAIASASSSSDTSAHGPPVAAGATERLATLPTTLGDPTALEGRKITAVRVEIAAKLWTARPPIASPRVGATFDLEVARLTLSHLLTSGTFASGSLLAQADGDGVVVIYRLVPSRMLRRVTVQGSPFADDDVRRAAKLSDARDVTEAQLDTARDDLRAYFARRGFPAATIAVVPVETDEPRTIIANVRIAPGPMLLVHHRTFVNAPEWDAVAIDAIDHYSVRVDDRADEDDLDLADRNLGNALRALNYPNAVVTHSVATAKGSYQAALTVVVSSGSKTILGFDGNLVFDDGMLLDLLALKTEADRSPSGLAAKIENAYRRRGYFDVHVTPVLLGAPGDRTRTLRFSIVEGDILTVSHREYPCLAGALSRDRIDNEIESFLDEELASGGFGDVSQRAADESLISDGDLRMGTRVEPDVPEPRTIYVAEIYDRATEHLRDLYRSEGYIFVEVGDAVLIRGSCAAGSQPGREGCIVVPPPPIPEICRSDLDGLPIAAAPIPRTLTCQADLMRGRACAPHAEVAISINPGPRSFLWDIAFDGTRALTPASLGKVVADDLRLGKPLSLNAVEAARRRVLEHYKDEGYAFASVRAALEYSPDRSRARARFTVVEGEQVIVDSILIDGNVRTLESLVRARITFKAGDPYRATEVRTSQDRLQSLGVFSSVSIGLINPTIPSKRKTVQVSLIERKRYGVDLLGGYSTGEGVRGNAIFTIQNLGGYAIALSLSARASYQPFLGPKSLYNPSIVNDWESLAPIDRIARQLSIIFTLPHSPLFGALVRTTFEFSNIVDIQAYGRTSKYTPALTMTYKPTAWFTAAFATDLEFNDFTLFPDQNLTTVIATNPGLFSLLTVPQGTSAVAAARATITFDFRDSRFNATKNGFITGTAEYVRSVLQKYLDAEYREDFMHLTGAAGVYFKLGSGRAPVLAFELQGGANVNVFSCGGDPQKRNPTPDPSVVGSGLVPACDTYPDRLFYLGGIANYRGFALVGSFYPQDVIDKAKGLGGVSLSSIGGNYYINPRAELRVPAFSFGGFVLFIDAANTWREAGNIKPWELRYAVGPGLSIDTPIGPFAIDLGFNLSPIISQTYKIYGNESIGPAITLALGRF